MVASPCLSAYPCTHVCIDNIGLTDLEGHTHTYDVVRKACGGVIRRKLERGLEVRYDHTSLYTNMIFSKTKKNIPGVKYTFVVFLATNIGKGFQYICD